MFKKKCVFKMSCSIGNKIKSGGFGDVYKVKLNKIEPQLKSPTYALKVIQNNIYGIRCFMELIILLFCNYSYIMNCFQFHIDIKERITKIDLPFDELTNLEIIRLKNQYYQRFIHLTTIDKIYFDLLIQYRKFSSCFIISAGQLERVNSIMNYHKLQAFFKDIYTSVKDKVKFINDRFQHTSILFDTEL
jgi:hypothetical protein